MHYATDFHNYSDEVLALFYQNVPAYRPAIDALREQRRRERELWNNPARLELLLWQEMRYRWDHGYSENDQARGVDEMEADRWKAMRSRIDLLRRQNRYTRRRLTRRQRRQQRQRGA
ncbi:MAG: hypothetical protein RLZZ387_1508 [Chloroflexota bacterium]|jgi:hypothetical protein